jgi:hypothetical protein
MVSLKKGIILGADLHGASRAGTNAQFAHTTLFLIEIYVHLWALNGEGTGWTNGDTGTAVGALLLVSFYFLIGILDMNPLIFEILYPFFEVFTGSG